MSFLKVVSLPLTIISVSLQYPPVLKEKNHSKCLSANQDNI